MIQAAVQDVTEKSSWGTSQECALSFIKTEKRSEKKVRKPKKRESNKGEK